MKDNHHKYSPKNRQLPSLDSSDNNSLFQIKSNFQNSKD